MEIKEITKNKKYLVKFDNLKTPWIFIPTSGAPLETNPYLHINNRVDINNIPKKISTLINKIDDKSQPTPKSEPKKGILNSLKQLFRKDEYNIDNDINFLNEMYKKNTNIKNIETSRHIPNITRIDDIIIVSNGDHYPVEIKYESVSESTQATFTRDYILQGVEIDKDTTFDVKETGQLFMLTHQGSPGIFISPNEYDNLKKYNIITDNQTKKKRRFRPKFE